MSHTKKLNNRKGFTLTEMLCVVAIVALLTLCIATGINMCVDTFRTTVCFSDAQTLASTVTTLICDELRFASRIETEPATVYVLEDDGEGGTNRVPVSTEVLTSYFSQNYGANSSIDLKEVTGRDDHQLNALYMDGQPVLGISAYTDDCSIEEMSIQYDKETQIFTVDFYVVDVDGVVLDTVHCQVKSLRA